MANGLHKGNDPLSTKERSLRMSLIRGKGNRSTELRLAALFRSSGIIGWRRHSTLVGKPDFCFSKHRVLVFVDGCFWHACPKCRRKTPTTNAAFWMTKIGRNAARDRQVTTELRKRGWKVVRIWEHELRTPNRAIARIRKALSSCAS